MIFNGKWSETSFARARRDKYNWVCFACRKSARRFGGAKHVACPRCGRACADIGCKIRVPPLGKKRQWQELQKAFEHWQQAHAYRRNSHG
jgi:hypothetical protein